MGTGFNTARDQQIMILFTTMDRFVNADRCRLHDDLDEGLQQRSETLLVFNRLREIVQHPDSIYWTKFSIKISREVRTSEEDSQPRESTYFYFRERERGSTSDTNNNIFFLLWLQVETHTLTSVCQIIQTWTRFPFTF